MKSLRKSLNSGGSSKDTSIRHHISTPLPLPAISKPSSSLQPPQKVIRALSGYRSLAPQELSFQKGDFFHVIKDVDIGGSWYEAHNPITGARGLVPRSLFEEFSKSNAPIRTSQAGPKTAPISPIPPGVFSPVPKPAKTRVFYAVVLHDFVAERADELDAKRGDNISVVAQSNREWFVAKPIGKLGRPGLIPVTFVEVRDPATNQPVANVQDLMDRGELPKVEDWKNAMFAYKENSIALGVIEDTPSRAPVQNNSMTPPSRPEPATKVADPTLVQYNETTTSQPVCLPEGLLLSADVVSFHLEGDEYWFRIDAIYQPYAAAGDDRLPPAFQLVLFRVYNDFYDFQVTLLNTFPREAGRQPGIDRILPFMPGPVEHVTQDLTASRRVELDEYMHKMCELSTIGARHVLEHTVVRGFLSQRAGDVLNPIEPRTEEMEAVFGFDYMQKTQLRDREGVDELRDNLGRMRFKGDPQSDGSEYEDEGYAGSPKRQQSDRHPYAQGYGSNRRPSPDRQTNNSLRQYTYAQNHQRNGSTAPSDRARGQSPSPYKSSTQTDSPPSDSMFSPTNQGIFRWPPEEQNMSSTGNALNLALARSRSQSSTNVNSPSISATNPQTAFVKIKIFDRTSDDLIAIRVHPRVSLGELMDKIQGRLGSEVTKLRYRDSMNRGFLDVSGDEALRNWISTTDKHVLYAD